MTVLEFKQGTPEIKKQPAAISVKNVLYATDFSATSESALPYATAICRKFGSTLHVAHVLSQTSLLLMDAARIPIIASLNGATLGGWTKYAKQIEQAGADAIECNIFLLQLFLEQRIQHNGGCARIPRDGECRRSPAIVATQKLPEVSEAANPDRWF
jgi:hypothetical protein